MEGYYDGELLGVWRANREVLAGLSRGLHVCCLLAVCCLWTPRVRPMPIKADCNGKVSCWSSNLAGVQKKQNRKCNFQLITQSLITMHFVRTRDSSGEVLQH